MIHFIREGSGFRTDLAGGAGKDGVGLAMITLANRNPLVETNALDRQRFQLWSSAVETATPSARTACIITGTVPSLAVREGSE